MNIGSVLVGPGSAALSVTAGAAGGAAPAAPTSATLAAASQPIGKLFGGLLGGLNQASGQRFAEQLGAALARFTRSAITGAAASGATSTSASSSGSLAFLKDAKLSVEEKLARLMVYLSDKYEKQLEQKLQQYAALEDGKATTTSTSKKGTSATTLTQGLSKLLSQTGLGKLLGGGAIQKLVGQVAGPVLAGAATALGMPALAPVLLKAGPLLGSVADGALSVLAEGAAATGTTAKTSSGSSSASSSSGAAPSEKALMTEIQILQEKQKEMFTLVSNILRSLHDTKMAVISNLR